MGLTPEQKAQLKDELDALTLADNLWVNEQIAKRDLDKPSNDPNWIRYKDKQIALLKKYVQNMWRATRVSRTRQMLDENNHRA
jgi:hypothetical protein